MAAMRDSSTEQKVGRRLPGLPNQSDLLEAIRIAHEGFLAHEDPKLVFHLLLDTLVRLTHSEYGFLDEICVDDAGKLYKRSLALSDISWDEGSRELYQQLEASQKQFLNLDNLAGWPARDGQVLIANSADTHPRSRGLPPGHPPIRQFMGMPLVFAGQRVGVAGIANRPGGYGPDLATFLSPFLSTCASVIHAARRMDRRREAEQRLRESETRFRTFFDTIEDSAYMVSPDGRILDINQAAMNMMGIQDKTEVVQQDLIDVVYPSASRERARHLFQTWQQVGSLNQEEIQILDAAGSRRTVLLSARTVRDDTGQVLHSVSIHRDITQQRLAQSRIQTSEAMFRQTFYHAPLLMSISDLENGEYIEVNQTFENLTGFSRLEAIGKTSVELGFIAPEDRLLLKKNMLEHGKIQGMELPLKKKNGESMVCAYSGVFIHVGGTRRLLSLAADITAQKNMQKQRRESEARFRQIAESIREVFWVRTQDTMLYVNPEFYRLTGISETEIQDDPNAILRFIHPDDLPSVKEALFRETQLQTMSVVFRVTGADNSQRWLRARAFPVLDEHGVATRTAGIAEDITELKKAEGELDESRRQLLNANLALERKNAALQELMQQIRNENDRLQTDVQTRVETLVRPLLHQLGDQAAPSARILLDLIEESLDHLTDSQSAQLAAKIRKLSRRETQICQLIAADKSTAEIARILGLSVRSVENHRYRIRKKLGAQHRRVPLAQLLSTE